jgi:hypothetical protein
MAARLGTFLYTLRASLQEGARSLNKFAPRSSGRLGSKVASAEPVRRHRAGAGGAEDWHLHPHLRRVQGVPYVAE